MVLASIAARLEQDVTQMQRDGVDCSVLVELLEHVGKLKSRGAEDGATHHNCELFLQIVRTGNNIREQGLQVLCAASQPRVRASPAHLKCRGHDGVRPGASAITATSSLQPSGRRRTLASPAVAQRTGRGGLHNIGQARRA